MERLNDYRQAIGWSVILSGVIVAVIQFVQGEILVGSIAIAAVVVAAGLLIRWTRPSVGGPHVGHAAAQAGACEDDVIVYWRPG